MPMCLAFLVSTLIYTTSCIVCVAPGPLDLVFIWSIGLGSLFTHLYVAAQVVINISNVNQKTLYRKVKIRLSRRQLCHISFLIFYSFLDIPSVIFPVKMIFWDYCWSILSIKDWLFDWLMLKVQMHIRARTRYQTIINGVNWDSGPGKFSSHRKPIVTVWVWVWVSLNNWPPTTTHNELFQSGLSRAESVLPIRD